MADWDIPPAADSGWGQPTGDNSTANDWKEPPAPGTADDVFTGISPEQISKHDGAMGDDTCRNCGESGHFSRECPQPRQMTGECFNCGQVGHNKADCPNEAVERPFTGTCRVCGEEGHRGSQCTKVECRTCGQQGHRSSDCAQAVCKKCGDAGHTEKACNNRYNVYPKGLADGVSADDSWEALRAADAAFDTDDFIKAFWVYCKAAPDLDFVKLELSFREMDFRFYLIAKEQLVPSKVHTNVDLQGNQGKKYIISFQKQPKPPRPKFADTWPKSPEENLERLEDAGFPMDKMVTLCGNCGEEGHLRKNCPGAPEAPEKPGIICDNCGEGHYLRDCTKPRASARGAADVECKSCGQTGHFARDCPDKPKQTCRNCLEEGHKAAECTNERVVVCRNCDGHGHTARECDQPVNMDNVTCRNCDDKGHYAKDCPKPKDWSKVQCRLCGDMGHGAGRCPNPPKDDFGDLGADAGAGAGADYTTVTGAVEAEGDWMNSGTAADGGAAEDWNTTTEASAVAAW